MKPIITGSVSFILYVVNTLIWFSLIMLFSLLKLIPLTITRKITSYLLDGCASAWVKCNTVNQRITSSTRIEVNGLEGLDEKDWYLVISNHQSWVDILILQRVLSGKIPFLKFFLKQELIWVPFLGLAWWALDFPFMKRYSKEFLQKNPHLRGKDIETTQKACEKFRYKPVSVMNFVEGTRFTPAKHSKQKSPYQHLLTPKAGGIAFVMGAMGDTLRKIVDVSIYYPGGRPTFWDYISGKVEQVVVDVQLRPIEDSLQGDYFEDEEFRLQFQLWVNQLWSDKEQKLQQLAQRTAE